MPRSPQPTVRGGPSGRGLRPTGRPPHARSALALLSLVLLAMAASGTTLAQTQPPPATTITKPRPEIASPSIPFRRWSPAAHNRVPFRPGRFESEIVAYENADHVSPPPPGAVLFVGSSSVKFWKTLQDDFEGIPILNRGFGGSQLEDLTHYASRIIQPYYARRIVIYAGDNDINAGKSPDEVLDDFRTLIHVIRRRQPRAPIAFLSIKPSPARAAKLESIRDANQRIREFCESQSNLEFIDIFTKMLDENGNPRRELYHRDGLHMAPAGYALWASELSRFVRAARGPMAMGSSRQR